MKKTTLSMDAAAKSLRSAGRQRRKTRALAEGRHSPTNRQDRAFDRETSRMGRTPAQQLVVLDQRLGKGIGAKRERKRLAA